MEYLTSSTSSKLPAPTVQPNTPIKAETVEQMMGVLESLLSHTHVFYDDYGTNCNCNCNCTRGSI